MPLRKPTGVEEGERLDIRPQFARSEEIGDIPRERLSDQSMSPETAYQVVHDELMLDGNARQNLATFVTTLMEPRPSGSCAEMLDKNMIDKDEYPQTAEIESRAA